MVAHPATVKMLAGVSRIFIVPSSGEDQELKGTMWVGPTLLSGGLPKRWLHGRIRQGTSWVHACQLVYWLETSSLEAAWL